MTHEAEQSGDKIAGGHGLLHAREGCTLLTSVEEGHDHGNAANAYAWFVRDSHHWFRGHHGFCIGGSPGDRLLSQLTVAAWNPNPHDFGLTYDALLSYCVARGG